MTNRIAFADVVAALPKATVKLRPDGESDAAANLIYPKDGIRDFVSPDLEVEADSIDPGAQVLLISAPAAVGKSSLARELSVATGNLLWDIGRFNVGSGFFTGTLTDVFGAPAFDSVRSALRAGEACLILDAADEALVRAGVQSYEAAMENLARLIGDEPSGQPSVVLLGRPDTTENSARILTELGISTQVLHVAFFAEDKARDFVKSKARGTGPYNVAESELTEFLEKFFSDVRSALGANSWDKGESFLGYAPVLDALATFYRREANPLKRLNQLKKADSSAHVWDLLVEIVQSVLDRESDKFASSFGGEDEIKAAFGRATYSRDLQRQLLLADDPEHVVIDFPDDESIELSWLEELEQQVRQQYKDHPFLGSVPDDGNPFLRFANVAFRDYVLASSLNDIVEDELSRLSGYWQNSLVNASPILSRFVFSADLAPRRLSLDGVTLLVDSHSSGFQDHVRLDIETFDADTDDPGYGMEVSLYERDVLVKSIESYVPPGEPIRLVRSVARTVINATSHVVVLGSGAQDFSAGPDVAINCAQLDVESIELRVTAKDGSRVEIRTERVQGSTRRVSVPVAGSLSIVVPVLAFPWQAFKSEGGDGAAPTESDLFWAGMELRNNVQWFARASMAGGSLSYLSGAMDTILSKGRASKTMFDYCREVGALTVEGPNYRLKLPGFSALVVLRNDTSDETYRKFLSGYLTAQTGP